MHLDFKSRFASSQSVQNCNTAMGEGNSTQTIGPGVEAFPTVAPTRTAYVESSSGPPTSIYLADTGHGTVGPDSTREGHQLALGLGLGLGGLSLILLVVRHFRLSLSSIELVDHVDALDILLVAQSSSRRKEGIQAQNIWNS